MISPMKLMKLVKKWKKMAAITRRRITLSRTRDGYDAASCNTLSNKGHFVVYTADQKRFVIPLVYLKNDIFIALLKLAEEEYRLPVDGPITVPCDAGFIEYAVSLIHRRVAKNMEKELVMSFTAGCFLSTSYAHIGLHNQQLPLSSF